MTTNATLATRVRGEVLKAIAKKCRNDQHRIFAYPHETKPYLREVNTITRKEKALTYTEAAQKYGEELDRHDLKQAYLKAKRMFDGQLSQTFLILFDEYAEETPQTNSTQREEKKKTSTQKTTRTNNWN